MDEANGSGWLRLGNKDEIEGLINLHLGDRYLGTSKKGVGKA